MQISFAFAPWLPGFYASLFPWLPDLEGWFAASFSTVSPWFRQRRPAGVCAGVSWQMHRVDIVMLFSISRDYHSAAQFSCRILVHILFFLVLCMIWMLAVIWKIWYKQIWIGRCGGICKRRQNCSPSPPAHSSFTYQKLANVLGEPPPPPPRRLYFEIPLT